MVIAYGRLLLTRRQTGGLHLESYEPVSESYEPIPISMYKAPINAKYCIRLKFRCKGRIFLSHGSCTVTSVVWVSDGLAEVKTIEKFKSPASKVVTVAYKRFGL